MGKRIFVGNLSFNTMEDDLVQLIEKDGHKVDSVRVMLDRETGRPRGFAFVEMTNDADAQAVIAALDGTELDGRALRVNEAQERAPRAGGGGGGGGRGGYGGGGGRRDAGGGYGAGGGDRW